MTSIPYKYRISIKKYHIRWKLHRLIIRSRFEIHDMQFTVLVYIALNKIHMLSTTHISGSGYRYHFKCLVFCILSYFSYFCIVSLNTFVFFFICAIYLSDLSLFLTVRCPGYFLNYFCLNTTPHNFCFYRIVFFYSQTYKNDDWLRMENIRKGPSECSSTIVVQLYQTISTIIMHKEEVWKHIQRCSQGFQNFSSVPHLTIYFFLKLEHFSWISYLTDQNQEVPKTILCG